MKKTDNIVLPHEGLLEDEGLEVLSPPTIQKLWLLALSFIVVIIHIGITI